MSAVRSIIQAVTVPGNYPPEHYRQIERLAKEWPTLAVALGALLTEQGVVPPRSWL